MILIFGGTTEGRLALKVCDEAHKPYFYSTKGKEQIITTPYAKRQSGAMDKEQMQYFCKNNSITLIIDAAHPFAEILHTTIAEVAGTMHIPVVRLERQYPPQDPTFEWLDNYEQAINYLKKTKLKNILILTGINTMQKLRSYWQSQPCHFRILDRQSSKTIAKKNNFPQESILYHNPQIQEEELFKKIQPNAILTKESGISGGFLQKTQAAKKLKIPVLVIKRPPLPQHFVTVDGEHTLRKTIERLQPDFFSLKTGFTTGTCATAAAKAALTTLLTGQIVNEITVSLPNNERVTIPIHHTSIHHTSIHHTSVTCTTIKDGGDDPDATHGYQIKAQISLNKQTKNIRFLPGEGIGTITLPGLGIEVGQPAINPTPRRMIKREIIKTLHHFSDKIPQGEAPTGVDVTLSVPQGEQLAMRTLNPKLGIVGGISIIGTSGVVRPFSSEAFVQSIHREIQVAKALECNHIVINSGAKSERFIKQQYPHLPMQAFIHYGNFIGETLKLAQKEKIQHISMGIMLGKAVKLAEGKLDTHSKHAQLNKDFLQTVAKQARCSAQTQEKIDNITMARQLWQIIPENEKAFFSHILKKCHIVCNPLLSSTKLEIMLIDEDGNITH